MTREDTEENSDKYIFSFEIDEERYDDNIEDNYTNVIFGNGNPATRQTVNLEFSESQLSNIFAPELYGETSMIRVFFTGSTQWAHIYIFGIGNNNNSWPGVEIRNKFNDSGYYSCIDSQTYNKMIFSKVINETVEK